MQKKSVYGLLLLALLFSTLVISSIEFVSAQSVVPDFFKDIWAQWSQGAGISENYARVMFLIIIGLLIYSVTDKIPGLAGEDKGWMRWVLAGVIAFLSTAYFTQAEIYALLISYSALGITLGMILPFLILVFFSYDIMANTNNIRNAWVRNSLVVMLWIVFGVYVVIRLFNTSGAAISDLGKYTGYIILLLIIGFLIGHRWVARRIVRGEIEGEDENVARTMEGSRRYTELQNQQFEAMGVGRNASRRRRRNV